VDAIEVAGAAANIVQTFFSDESGWEISLPAVDRLRVREQVKRADVHNPLPSTLFDDAYNSIMRDMARSIQQFSQVARVVCWFVVTHMSHTLHTQSDVYRSYAAHASLVEALYDRTTTGQTSRTRVRSESMESEAEHEMSRAQLLVRDEQHTHTHTHTHYILTSLYRHE
jgi:hypothetical protein